MPYGVNAIVAIMSYTGYNVEDAILINEGAVERGLFRTTYYSMYEAHEETSKNSTSNSDIKFADVLKMPEVKGIKKEYDYDALDEYGLIKEETEMHEKRAVIGRITVTPDVDQTAIDSSVFPKKGQLGIVDKSFMTDGEEGTRIAKVRIREERIPAIGDKMASRAGQKGTIGLIIPEKDMPYAKDGTVPDLIINPHAIPSRMTLGQLLEALIGKAAASIGTFGDCTAFTMKGANTEAFGKVLVDNGYHSSGNQVMYSGFTGEQMTANIFIGPTYYMRLKHMVKDKINSRPSGKRVFLTRQPNQGRANDGGLRIGEMERDGIMAHGASSFLNDAFMNRADEFYMAICNTTGAIAAYNKETKTMLSPHADGPLQFKTSLDGNVTLDKISHYGRSFSIVRVPYSFKLLLQELQAMNIHMKIITNDNIDHLTSMAYSDNVNKIFKDNSKLNNIYEKIRNITRNDMKNIISDPINQDNIGKPPVTTENITSETVAPSLSNAENPDSDKSVQYETGEINYTPNSPDQPPVFNPTSPQLPPPSDGNTASSNPVSDDGHSINYDDYYMTNENQEAVNNDEVPDMSKFTMSADESSIPQEDKTDTPSKIKDPNVQAQFDALPEKDKLKLMKAVSMMESEEEVSRRKEEAATRDRQENLLKISTDRLENTKLEGEKQLDQSTDKDPVSILKIDTSEKDGEDGDDEKDDSSNSENKSGGSKKIAFSLD